MAWIKRIVYTCEGKAGSSNSDFGTLRVFKTAKCAVAIPLSTMRALKRQHKLNAEKELRWMVLEELSRQAGCSVGFSEVKHHRPRYRFERSRRISKVKVIHERI